MNTRPLLAVIVVIVLLGLAFLLFSRSGSDAIPETATTTSQGTVTTPSADTPTNVPTPGAVTIRYGAGGFSPASVTVIPGTTVTWVNEGSGRMWVGADEHPTHTEYDGTSTGEHCANGTATSAGVFDQCRAGASYSFTFTRAGSFDYHNHAEASHGGTVTVR